MPVTTTQRDSLQSDHVSMTLPQNSGMESLSLLGYFWPKLAQQHKKTWAVQLMCRFTTSEGMLLCSSTSPYYMP